MSKIKDKLYYKLVTSRPFVKTHYENYVNNNLDYHRKHRLKSWFRLLQIIRLSKMQIKVLEHENNSVNIIPNNPKSSSSIPIANNIPSPPSPKLPYLNGSESKSVSRSNPFDLVKKFLEYDIVSFDVFDTLVFRPFNDPKAIFMIIGEKLKQTDFYTIRTSSEREARQKQSALYNNVEIDIYDIYKIIENKTGIDAKYGAQVEIDTEIEMCFSNPYMKRIYKLLLHQNKKMIAISDMYLPSEIINKILVKCGYHDIQVYSSCDYKCSKRNGDLYRTILHHFGENTKICHIGDNYESDYTKAISNGIVSFHYRNINWVGHFYRAEGMSNLIGSAYCGIVNATLHNGITKFSPHYEYGFIYGGLYILGFANWLKKRAEEKGITKILFLSRDGDVFSKVFNKLNTNIESEYFYWSRIANIKYAVSKKRYEFLTRMVYWKAHSVYPITVSNLFESLDLNFLVPFMKEYNIPNDALLSKTNVKYVEQIVVDNWDNICDYYSNSRSNILKLIKQSVGTHKHIGIVDIGWAGTGPLGLKDLIKNDLGLDCEVLAFVAANRHHVSQDVIIKSMTGEIESYLFSATLNYEDYNIHSNTNNNFNNIFLELFTQACSPTFSGIDNQWNFSFDVPEVENFSTITEIQKGICDFADIYIKTFKNYPYMLNISGHDAYAPFKMIIKNLKFFKDQFSSFSFSRGVLADNSKQNIESLYELMKQAKLL